MFDLVAIKFHLWPKRNPSWKLEPFVPKLLSTDFATNINQLLLAKGGALENSITYPSCRIVLAIRPPTVFNSARRSFGFLNRSDATPHPTPLESFLKSEQWQWETHWGSAVMQLKWKRICTPNGFVPCNKFAYITINQIMITDMQMHQNADHWPVFTARSALNTGLSELPVLVSLCNCWLFWERSCGRPRRCDNPRLVSDNYPLLQIKIYGLF